MADVENLHTLIIDAVEDLISVSADDLDADRWVGCHTRAQWIERNVVDGRMNGCDHVLCTRHASFVKIPEDAIEIGERQLPVTDSHSKP